MRIKNQLDPGPAGLQAGSRDTAGATGYRDLALNLLVRSELARERRADWHVCEVRLMLIDFARLKCDEGHARYVKWRNSLGE